jgi:hypothetical protein
LIIGTAGAGCTRKAASRRMRQARIEYQALVRLMKWKPSKHARLAANAIMPSVRTQPIGVS